MTVIQREMVNQIIHGDCVSVLPSIPENSVDCLVTDPPYFLINDSGKGFMGKDWESLSESKIMDILCKSKSIVKNVERFLMLHQVEQNIIVEDSAQNNAKTNGCQELKTQNKTLNVQCAENNSKEANRKEKASMSSVHGFVLTKAEALDLLKELCPNHITAIENLKENVLFAIPYSFIVSLLKGTVLENVLKFPIETVCSEKTILLSLMEEARINAVTEAMIGKLSDYKCMNVTNTPVEQKDAEYIVKEKRYRHITSNPINNQKIIHWLTLLLSATNVTLKSKKDLYQYTIYQFHLNWLQEALRVLKNGSFAFIITTPRQDSLSSLISAVKDAGFEVGFTPIVWTYASGFPKAMNVAKMVDKRLGEKGTVINPKTYPDIRCNNYSNSQGKTRLCGGDYLPSANEAKALDGSFGGFQPKPAVEIVIVAMKSLSEKSFVDQALANGKGVTWLDDCRIPVNPEIDDMLREVNRKERASETWQNGSGFKNESNSLTGVHSNGRFPANLLASDNILDDGKITKSPSNYVNRKPRNGSVFTLNSCGFDDTQNHMSGYGDVGGFSRYFSLDAWFSEAVKKLPKEVQKTFPFLIVPKASKSERNKGCESLPEDKARAVMFTTANNTSGVVSKGFERFETLPKRNFHPTVKPLKLMSYLVTLGSRPNDLVLDPFCGSGTTCLAAKMLGRNYIGIEKEEQYITLANSRVGSHKDTALSNFLSVETKECQSK